MKRWIVLLTVALVSMLIACGPVLTSYVSGTDFDTCPDEAKECNDTEEPALGQDRFARQMAARFGLMALFAQTVYRHDLEADERDENGCGYVKSKEPDTSGMPKGDANGGHWERWKAPNVPVCVNKDGLYYEIYVYRTKAGAVDEAVIAFRGTENRWSQVFKDWWTNLSAIFGFEPYQYRLARGYLPRAINMLEKENPQIRIYAVGHSLGGGLAQQLGYLSSSVQEVITFNTSPVTNWTHLRLDRKVANNYPTIFRIYHNGEALEKLRFVSTSFTSTRYGRYDIGVQFKPKSNFKGHSMSIFACTFAALVASNGDAMAEHQYSKLAARMILEEPGICDERDRDEFRTLMIRG